MLHIFLTELDAIAVQTAETSNFWIQYITQAFQNPWQESVELTWTPNCSLESSVGGVSWEGQLP